MTYEALGITRQLNGAWTVGYRDPETGWQIKVISAEYAAKLILAVTSTPDETGAILPDLPGDDFMVSRELTVTPDPRAVRAQARLNAAERRNAEAREHNSEVRANWVPYD